MDYVCDKFRLQERRSKPWLPSRLFGRSPNFEMFTLSVTFRQMLPLISGSTLGNKETACPRG
jgi:hypothetical protein